MDSCILEDARAPLRRIAVIWSMALALAFLSRHQIFRAADLASLQDQIAREYPTIHDPALSDWERVSQLRQWCWSHTPIPQDRSGIYSIGWRWWVVTAPDIFELFASNSCGASYCSGAADALRLLYDAYGYEAYTVESGHAGGTETHVVTLVRIDHEGESLLSVQDAYFNVTFVEAASGRPLDYYRMLALLAEGNDEAIRVVEPDFFSAPSWPRLVVSPSAAENNNPDDIIQSSFATLSSAYRTLKLPDGTLIVESPRTLRRFVETQCYTADGQAAWYLKWLANQGHPPELLYLFLYPNNFNSRDAFRKLTGVEGQMQEKASAIAARATATRRH
jgi:hypothetical protein